MWLHLQTGDSQPAIDLFLTLERNGCAAAARGFLKDLAGRIVEAPARMGSERNEDRFMEAAKFALGECLRNDQDAIVRYMRAALRSPGIRDLFRFRLVHMFALTTGCAVATSLVGSLAAIAAIYCCVLIVVLPLYAVSLYRAYCGNDRTAKTALLTSVTIFFVFLFAMTRTEIRAFYPPPFWCIPPTLIFAASYVEKIECERRRLFSPPARQDAS